MALQTMSSRQQWAIQCEDVTTLPARIIGGSFASGIGSPIFRLGLTSMRSVTAGRTIIFF